MTARFFEKEVRKIQERFNQAFGDQVTFRIQARHAALLSICRLGILEKRIARIKDKPREGIQEFIRIRDTLNNLFNLMEKTKKGKEKAMKKRTKDSNNAACG